MNIQENKIMKSGEDDLHACEIFSICREGGEILKKRRSMRDVSVYRSGVRAGESLNPDFGYSDCFVLPHSYCNQTFHPSEYLDIRNI